MVEFLPEDLRRQLVQAARSRKRRAAKRSVHVGDEAFAILEMSDKGFCVDAEETPRLRGLVDIYEGPRHLYQALIVAASRDGEQMRYDFKRNTAASANAPVDFERKDSAPIALLSNS